MSGDGKIDNEYLNNLANFIIKAGKNALLMDKTKTWADICKKASGRFFKYEYIANHKIRVTDNGTKQFVEKRLPSVDIVGGKPAPTTIQAQA